jgi:dUTP pyrophosphatase
LTPELESILKAEGIDTSILKEFQPLPTTEYEYIHGLIDPVMNIDVDECTVHFPLSRIDMCIFKAVVKEVYEYSSDGIVTLRGSECIDFLNKLHADSRGLVRNTVAFHALVPSVCIRISKTRTDSVMPFKARLSDVGYDLCVVAFVKQLTPDTALYDTGISIAIDHGWYTEIVPRSSLSKTGYTLANSIGIIDNGYRGSLKIALTRGKFAKDIEYPFRCCQLIVRKQYWANILEIDSPLESTTRQTGGFGSTNNHVG